MQAGEERLREFGDADLLTEVCTRSVKGGATFAGMAGMPHVSAIITNLGSELALVDRFQDALQGEVVRRQELLRAAGNFASVSDYEKARKGGRTDLEPLPALLGHRAHRTACVAPGRLPDQPGIATERGSEIARAIRRASP